MRAIETIVACGCVAMLAVPVFGQSSLSATPQAGFEGIADCSDLGIYDQPFDSQNFGTARTSDVEAGFRVFENFFDGTSGTNVRRSRHWGIEIDFSSPTFLCSEDDQANFNVAFWGQSGGAPDTFNMIAEVTDTPAVETDTGVPFGGFGNVISQDLAFPDLDITGTVWVSHERVNDSDSCFWLWVDETAIGTYDDQAYQEGGGGFVTSDQAFCLGEAGDDGGPGDDGGDGGVPATTGAGIVLLIVLVGGSGLYFWKRGGKS